MFYLLTSTESCTARVCKQVCEKQFQCRGAYLEMASTELLPGQAGSSSLPNSRDSESRGVLHLHQEWLKDTDGRAVRALQIPSHRL